MKFQPLHWVNLTVVAVAVVLLAWWQFGTPDPVRPPNVPSGATMVGIPFGVNWDYCWVDKLANENKCQIFDKGGGILYEGIFQRYKGSGLVPDPELKITQRGGEQWIELENGVILIPKTDYDRIKNFLDSQHRPR